MFYSENDGHGDDLALFAQSVLQGVVVEVKVVELGLKGAACPPNGVLRSGPMEVHHAKRVRARLKEIVLWEKSYDHDDVGSFLLGWDPPGR